MTGTQWTELVLFAALMLALSMFALSASGHFPKEHRGAAFTSWFGGFLLLGSIALAAALLIASIYFIGISVPWYVAVIGGGASVLMAPLVLQMFSDNFVNGRSSLLTLTSLAAVLLMGIAYLH